MLSNNKDMKLRIHALNQLMEDTDDLVLTLTNILRFSFYDLKIPHEDLLLFQMYVASLSVLVIELKSILRLVDKGTKGATEILYKKIKLMDDYVVNIRNKLNNILG